MGSVAWELSLWSFRLGTFAYEVSFGIRDWELAFANFRAWELSLESFRFGTFDWETLLRIFRVRSLDLDCSLGNFRFRNDA